MNPNELAEAKRFESLSTREKDDLEKNKPKEFDRLMKLVRKIWLQWEKEFSDECFTPGRPLKKVKRGGKPHPFFRGVMVKYWPTSWKMLQQVQRGVARDENDSQEQQPLPIGDILKTIDTRGGAD